jgi:hypothetical protein
MEELTLFIRRGRHEAMILSNLAKICLAIIQYEYVLYEWMKKAIA